MDVDTYGGVSADEFLFTLSEDVSQVMNVEPRVLHSSTARMRSTGKLVKKGDT